MDSKHSVIKGLDCIILECYRNCTENSQNLFRSRRKDILSFFKTYILARNEWMSFHFGSKVIFDTSLYNSYTVNDYNYDINFLIYHLLLKL